MSDESLTTTMPLSELYERDETAWLDRTAELVVQQRWDEVDREHLGEYLTDMATRDRREVVSRLAILLSHWLKWDHQPQKRTRSWQRTLLDQQLELAQIFESATLRKHGGEIFDKAYARAMKKASVETGLPMAAFPASPPWSLDETLARPVEPL